MIVYSSIFRPREIEKDFFYYRYTNVLNKIEYISNKLPNILQTPFILFTMAMHLVIPLLLAYVVFGDESLAYTILPIIFLVLLKWYYMSKSLYECKKKEMLNEIYLKYENEVKIYEEIINSYFEKDYSNEFYPEIDKSDKLSEKLISICWELRYLHWNTDKVFEKEVQEIFDMFIDRLPKYK